MVDRAVTRWIDQDTAAGWQGRRGIFGAGYLIVWGADGWSSRCNYLGTNRTEPVYVIASHLLSGPRGFARGRRYLCGVSYTIAERARG